MNMFYNNVVLRGTVANDPEILTLKTGRTLVKFRLLTKIFWKSGDEFKEKLAWHNVQAWGHTADDLAKTNISKGDAAFVAGALQYDSWEDNDGVKKITASINANTVIASHKGSDIMPNKDVPKEDDDPFQGNPADDDMPF